ncbi:MAG: PIG-L family deacetylase [Ktedonobacteraceae bacterium]|nr:PIG-L family deacetylase [Ktedonobacteraceae bacterium]
MAKRTPGDALPAITTPDYEAMVIGAHPDDADVGAGATSALWVRQGKKVVWVIMTDGTEGSEIPGLSETELMHQREREQRQACELLGIQAVEFLRFPDGHLANTEVTRKALVRLMRQYRPRLVVTHDPEQRIIAPDPDEQPDATAYLNHPDHRATGNIVLDALFPAVGNPRAYRELLVEGLLPYRVHEVYFFLSSKKNTYIDVSETMELKVKALHCHSTQSHGEFSMTEWFLHYAVKMAREASVRKGLDMQYAEEFRRVKLYVPSKREEIEAV